MDTGLIHLHNLLRWVILILLVISIFKAFSGWQQKKAFSPGDKKVWLFTMIAGHITLLIGLYQWLWGRYGMLVVSPPEGVSVMKDKFFRFFLGRASCVYDPCDYNDHVGSWHGKESRC